MSKNPFGIGRPAKEKANYTQLENQLAIQFRKGIMSRNVPNITDTSYGQQIIPLPDNALTTRYFKDKTITGEKIAKNIVFRHTPIFSSDLSFSHSPSTIKYIFSSINARNREVITEDQLAEILDQFSDEVDAIKEKLPPIDPSLHIIAQPNWVTESRIADHSITTNKLVFFPLPANISLENTNSTVGTYPATTNYVLSQLNEFVGDSSFSIGELAIAIAGVSDVSFNSAAATKTNKSTFDISFGSIRNTIQKDGSLAFISQLQTPTIPNFDASLNTLYSRNSSLISTLAEISLNDIPSFVTRDSSFVLIKTKTDASFADIFANGWVSSSRFDSSLTLPSLTELNTETIDASSNMIATTAFVKAQLQENIATAELATSYGALANAINQDASFSYNVVRHITGFDASISSFSTKTSNMETTMSTDFPMKTDSVNIIERKTTIQDISVNIIQTQYSDTVLQIDGSLIILENAATNIETLRPWIPYFDGSASSTQLSLNNSVVIIETLSAKYDASYSQLNEKIQELKLVEVDSSLNTELNNRENRAKQRFDPSYNETKTKLQQLDASFSAVVQSSTASILGKLDRADTSLAIITPQLADVSFHVIDFGEKTDSSLVFLRENLTLVNSSLEESLSHMDSCLNSIYRRVDDISSNIDISTYINQEYEGLKLRADNDMQISDSSLSWFSHAFVFRDTRWSDSANLVDASFQLYRNTWNQLDSYAREKMEQIAMFDGSFNSLYGMLNIRSIDSSLAYFSQNYETNKENLDSSLNGAKQNIELWENRQFLTLVNGLETAIKLQDSSLILVGENGWVSTEKLAPTIELVNATCVVANDASGNQIANTAFFKEKLREVVGMATAPLDGINELSAAVNNQEDYAIYIGGYLNDISTLVGSIRTAIADLSTNTTAELNYDTSLNTLGSAYSALESTASAIDSSFVLAKQTLDASLTTISAIMNWIDGSWNAIQRTDEIDNLSSLQEFYISTFESATYDASISLLGETLTALENAATAIASDASFIALSDLSGLVQNKITALDMSYGIAYTKWSNQANNERFPKLDSSFSAISSAITAVETGIKSYLNDSVAGSSYQTSFSIMNGRLLKTDASLAAAETYMNSFVVDICDNIAVSSILSNLNSDNATITSTHNTNAGNILTIDSSGWVVSRLLDPSLVLPTGVRISTGNIGIATVADVKTSIQGLIGNAGPALDTLGEFAAALNQDASLSSTFNSRLLATDGSLNAIGESIRIKLEESATANARDGSVNSVANQYSSVITMTTNLSQRIGRNDASTNLAATTISSVNGKTETVSRRLATNDTSTNLLDGRMFRLESSSNIIELSLVNRERIAGTVDSSFTNIRNTATQIPSGITTNDTSTNLLPALASVRETSANTIVALLGTPTNFRFSGNTTTSLTCSYNEPILRDSIGVNNYRLTARPIYGSVSTVVRDVSAGINQIQLTGLPSGAVYDLSLATRNPYGTIVLTGVSGTTALYPPTGITGSASTTSSFTVSWTSGGGNLTKYAFNLKNGAIDVSSGEITSATTSRSFTGLTDGTPYLVAVRAGNPYMFSQDVSMIYGTIFAAPALPTFVSRTTTDLSFSVAGTTKPYVRYNISYRAITGGSITSATDTSSNMRLTGLANGRIYDVSVNIQNAYGTSVWSPRLRNSTTIVLPALSIGNITSSSIDVSFSSALATQDCSYVLRTEPEVARYVLSAGATSRSLTGLSSNTLYRIILDASNLYTSSFVDTSGTTLVETPNNYRYYQFSTTLLKGDLNYTIPIPIAVQFSELSFRNNGVRVDYSTAVATNPAGVDNPANEGPENAIDDNVDTKFLSFTSREGYIDYTKTPLIVDFGKPTQITEYTFATANDAEDRDPVSWILSGSNNGTTWTTIQTIDAFSTTSNRKTYLPYFNVSPTPPPFTSSLTYYYDFEKYSGQNLANSYSDILVFDASLVNATLTTTAARLGAYGIESTMVSGTDYMVKMPNINFATMSSFTISVSVNISSFSGSGNNPWLVSFRNASLIYGIRISSTSITVYTDSGNTSVSATGLTIDATKWYTITVSQSPTTTNIYMNGVLQATQSMSVANSNGFVSSMATLGSGGDSSIFQGYMDDYRFYSAVLTDTEILNIHNLYPFVYNINSMVVTSEFTSQGNGAMGIALDATLSRAVLANFSGEMRLSKYQSGAWTSFTAFDTTSRSYYSGVALTDDGNLGVASVGNFGSEYIYKFTWNSGTSNYTTLTRIGDDNSRRYNGIGITPTGTRLATCVRGGFQGGYIYYANWDSGTSNFGALIQTGESGSRTYSGIAISRDGSRIVYGTESGNCYFANWNSDTNNYDSGTQIGSSTFFSTGFAFTNDMNQIWMATAYNETGSLWYSFWNGTTYDEFVAVPTSKVPANLEGWGLWINPTSTLLILAPYSSSIYYRIVLPLS